MQPNYTREQRCCIRLQSIGCKYPSAKPLALGCEPLKAAATAIAEGCGRSGEAELARFCQIASGSASELEYQLFLARDLKLIKPSDYKKLAPLTIEIKRMLTVFIQKLNAES
jgi:hypothetical protein